ncbi:hypothetical protein P9112_001060 [Eukaryota sp. TZLM1-RC]
MSPLKKLKKLSLKLPRAAQSAIPPHIARRKDKVMKAGLKRLSSSFSRKTNRRSGKNFWASTSNEGKNVLLAALEERDNLDHRGDARVWMNKNETFVGPRVMCDKCCPKRPVKLSNNEVRYRKKHYLYVNFNDLSEDIKDLWDAISTNARPGHIYLRVPPIADEEQQGENNEGTLGSEMGFLNLKEDKYAYEESLECMWCACIMDMEDEVPLWFIEKEIQRKLQHEIYELGTDEIIKKHLSASVLPQLEGDVRAMEPAEEEQEMQQQSAIGQAQLPKDLRKKMQHMSKAGSAIQTELKEQEYQEKKQKEAEERLHTEEDCRRLHAELNLSCECATIGKEVGDNGTPHLQGCFKLLGEGITLAEMNNWEILRGCHTDPMKAPKKAREYCKKEGNVILDFGWPKPYETSSRDE